MNYLQFHRDGPMYINKKPNYAKKLSVFDELLIEDVNENSLQDYYISTILFRNNNLEPFQPYIELNFLKNIQAKVLVLKGEPIENIEKDYKPINLLTSIELEPWIDNPKEFTRTELVKFSMNIKNISRLLVKVLELNPKNYYLVHNKQITSNIKLDGLVAKSEYSYEYTEQPQIRVRREFSFPELKDKAGIFVIEFFGNGRQSRVIIKKGSLRYISRPNAAGEFMYVMNEDNIICKENAGVYIDSRFYEARQEDGRIDVPFARTSSYKSIILTDGVIAELCSNFFHTSENYKLETAFLIHKEQLLSATHTSIYLRPKLYVNNIKAPDSLLKDCRAVMNIMNIDGSGLSKTYSDFVV